MAKRNEPLRQVISSPAAFRGALRIDTDAGPQALGAIADPWQLADYAKLDPAWQRFASHVKDSGSPCLQRAYLERPRGHSKTLDTAQYGSYAVAASPRTIYGVWAAADREQARLSRDTVAAFVRNNPWLSKLLDVQAYKIINTLTGSALEIISSDAATSYGITPDFIVCDELTHWKNQDLWVSLLSSAAKKSNCILLIIANAGLGQGSSWQWLVREGCRLDPDWIFSRLDGPRASWISPS